MISLVMSPNIKFGQLHSDKLAMVDSKGASIGAVMTAYGSTFWKHFYYAFKFSLPLEFVYEIAVSDKGLSLTSQWNPKTNCEDGILSGSVEDFMSSMLALCTTTQDKTMRAVFNTINAYFENDKIYLPITKSDIGDKTYAILYRGS